MTISIVQSANIAAFPTTANMATGGTTVTATGSFATPQTNNNNNLLIKGAAAAGADLHTTASAFPTTSTATVSPGNGSGGTITNVLWLWGNIGAGSMASNWTTQIQYTFGTNNVAGNLISIIIKCDPAMTASVADSRNTYASMGLADHSQDYFIGGFYAKNIGAGANTITVTFSGSALTSTNASFSVIEWAGLDKINPLNAYGTAAAATGGNTAGSVTKSITTSRPGVVLASSGVDQHVISSTAGLTIVEGGTPAAPNTDTYGDSDAYAIQNGVGTFSPGFQQSASAPWQILVVALAAANSTLDPIGYACDF